MTILHLINGVIWVAVAPCTLLLVFFFMTNRSPFQAAARVHWLLAIGAMSAVFSVIAALMVPKIFFIPLPKTFAEYQLSASAFSVYQSLLIIYVFGCSWCLSYLIAGIRDVTRISTSATELPFSQLPIEFPRVAGKKIDIKTSAAIRSPLVWGWRQPTILLPIEYRQWSDARLARVMTHELAHIDRNDWIIKLTVRVACGLLWYLPPVWMVARKMDWYAELACDDEVINRYNCRAEYANDLLDIAADSKHTLFAMSLNKGSMLFARIDSVLDGCRNRGKWSSKTERGILISTLLLCVPVAAIQASVSKQAFSASGARNLYPLIIPEDRNSQAQREASLVATGAPPSDQPLSTQVPRPAMHIARSSREELVVIGRFDRENLNKSLLNIADNSDSQPTMDFPNVTFSGYLPVKMVTPEYPIRAIKRGIEGKVIVQFDVDIAGEVENIRIAYASPKSIFDRSVVMAVKQFRFTPLTLNGELIKTKNVTETFVFTLKEFMTDNKKTLNFTAPTHIADAK